MNDIVNYEEWMQRAKESIRTNVTIGMIFELRALFTECEWTVLTTGDRRSFGRYFANEIKEKRVEGVMPVEKAKNNHSRYRKIS